MPAATITELYDIDDTILSASVAALSGSGITAVYRERDVSNISTPFVALQIESGNPIHQWYLENTGSVYDAWNYTMEVNVVTDRVANDVSHSIYRNRAINTLGDYRSYSGLTYWIVDNLEWSGVSKGINETEDKDISTINMKFNVWIKPDAWPS